MIFRVLNKNRKWKINLLFYTLKGEDLFKFDQDTITYTVVTILNEDKFCLDYSIH